MNIVKKENFYESFYEESCISSKYAGVHFNTSTIEIKKYDDSSYKIFDFQLFPNYLKPIFQDNLSFKKVNIKPGFAIDLRNYSSFEEFYNHYKSSFRKVINRSVKRLDKCFDTHYKMFYGNINKEDYLNLMGRLHEMIKNRFQERDGRNKVLENWDYYLKFAFHSINTSKASLFVIYSSTEPIEISLNFHHENIMYSSISSYDLDYGKFSLGNIEIYKQVEWCFKNNIAFFDMGYGDFDYKRRWSNHTYNFEAHIVSENRNFISYLYTVFVKQKIRLTNYLIQNKINDKIYNLIDIVKRKKSIETPKDTYEFIEPQPTNALLNTIDITDNNYAFLKKPIFDFLYKSSEHINDISVSEFEDEHKTYIIKGKKTLTKLRFTHASN